MGISAMPPMGQDADDSVEELALEHPEITLAQEWIAPSEAAAIGSYIRSASVSEATVRRWCRDGVFGDRIRIKQTEGGSYFINLPDLLAERRATLEKYARQLEHLEDLRRRARGDRPAAE